jgi:predicted ATPase
MPGREPGAFGALLRSFRIDRNLSQEDLAGRARLSMNAIGLLERGERTAPRRTTLAALADALDLPLDAREELERSARISSPRTDTGPPQGARRAPRRPDRFFGRAGEFTRLERLLHSARCVSIVGKPGIGKSRLALEFARRVEGDYPDGIRIVDLAVIDDPQSIMTEVARTLSIASNTPDQSAAVLLHASALQALIIFDNCEHVANGANGAILCLLDAAPRCSFVVTSRHETLALGAESVRLNSLSTPNERSSVNPLTYESVALFVDRATTTLPTLTLDDNRLQAVAEICRLLDGSPLAIELAAMRLRSLSLSDLLTSLADELGTLTLGRRGAVGRHSSLTAAISWSYRLLWHNEKAVLTRLSVFAGAFKASGAVAVACDDSISATTVRDTLEQLVAKSLVMRTGGDVSPRYEIERSVRAFGEQRLRESSDYQDTWHRLTQHLSDVADRANDLLESMPYHQYLNAFLPDFEDARRSVRYALCEGHNAAAGGRILGGFRAIWKSRGLPRELYGYSLTALGALDHDQYPHIAASLNRARTLAAVGSGEIFIAEAPAIRLALKRVDDRVGCAVLDALLGHELLRLGRVREADTHSFDAIETFDGLDVRESHDYGQMLGLRVDILIELDRLAEAEVVTGQLFELGKRLSDPYLTGHASARHAMLRFARGNSKRAAQIAQNLVSSRALSAGSLEESAVLIDLAGYRVAAGHPAALRTAKFAAARNCVTNAYARYSSLCTLSAALAEAGQIFAALHVLEDVERQTQEQHWSMRRLERLNVERCVDILRRSLGSASVPSW